MLECRSSYEYEALELETENGYEPLNEHLGMSMSMGRRLVTVGMLTSMGVVAATYQSRRLLDRHLNKIPLNHTHTL